MRDVRLKLVYIVEEVQGFRFTFSPLGSGQFPPHPLNIQPRHGVDTQSGTGCAKVRLTPWVRCKISQPSTLDDTCLSLVLLCRARSSLLSQHLSHSPSCNLSCSHVRTEASWRKFPPSVVALQFYPQSLSTFRRVYCEWMLTTQKTGWTLWAAWTVWRTDSVATVKYRVERPHDQERSDEASWDGLFLSGLPSEAFPDFDSIL
ncbi:hypothetical protein GE21DRAFT_1013160 [Neurospora crassa]|nr:hypothetical protein GE21DRAFT_1013160 [Neurospora crassa]